MILEAIHNLLRGDARVNSITTRIRTDVLDQNTTLPAITFFRITGVSFEGLAETAEMEQARLQIDCFALTRTEAADLAEQVRLVLQKFQGVVTTSSGDQFIQEISVSSGTRDDMDPVELGDNQRRYYTSRDYFVFFEPPK